MSGGGDTRCPRYANTREPSPTIVAILRVLAVAQTDDDLVQAPIDELPSETALAHILGRPGAERPGTCA